MSSANENGQANINIWATLLDCLRDQRSAPFLAHLKRDEAFTDACHQWSETVIDSWLQRLPVMLLAASKDSEKHPQNTEPSPLQVLLTCAFFEVGFKSKAVKVLWFKARDLSENLAKDGRRTRPTSFEQDLLRQLLRVWYLVLSTGPQRSDSRSATFSQLAAKQILDPSLMEWSFLPAPEAFSDMLQQRAASRKSSLDLSEALASLTGTANTSFSNLNDKIVGNQRHYDSASAAVMTLGLLADLERQPEGDVLVQDFRPWMDLFARIKRHRAIDKQPPAALAERMAMVSNAAVQEHYESLRKWFSFDAVHGGAIPLATRADGIEGVGQAADNSLVPLIGLGEGPTNAVSEIEEPVAPSSNASHVDRLIYLAIKRLRRAGREHDVKLAEKVKVDVETFGITHKQIQIPVQVYEHLILTFLVLRNFNQAMECWNLLVGSGHRPTVKTYTIALRYSQFLKGADTVQFFWEKMKQDKLQPDVYAWSARIFGLSRRGKPELAIRAMLEMSQDWFAAARAAYVKQDRVSKSRRKEPLSQEQLLHRYESDVNGVPRPTIYVMNSAIDGLNTRGGDSELIPKVLAWGRMFGIKPDLITYNTLLQITMRNEMQSEALGILRRMKEQEIAPDGETWTILLSSIFNGGSLDGLEPQAQEDRIIAFIHGLENASAAAIDSKGYALILDRMLKQYYNPQAAQKVLAEMTSRGIEPTAYHYTILMTSYFQQSPPDLPAIQSLWNRIRGAQTGYGKTLGSQFYDQMIEGYATHHKLVGTAPMMSFLARMESEGKLPSWRALEALVRALAQAQEWDQMSRVVDTIRRRLREAGVGGTTQGQHEFWKYVVSTGILKHEGITDASQIQRENTGRGMSEQLQMSR
jgi:hypothetical protein